MVRINSRSAMYSQLTSASISHASTIEIAEDFSGRALSQFEKKRIEDAVHSALKELPARLVKEMENIPPANEKIARLYQTTVAQLAFDRKTAMHMITLHTVMEKLIETRNKFWDRSGRELMSEQIDNYAREVILQKARSRSVTKKTMVPYNQCVTAQYVVGVSQKEKNVLNKATQFLMGECVKLAHEADKNFDLSLRPIEEFEKAEMGFKSVMGGAFSEFFKQINSRLSERDHKGSLIGINQRKLNQLNQCLCGDSNAPPDLSYWLGDWLRYMQVALTQAVSELPLETQNAWKYVYAKQFSSDHYDLEYISDTGAALWELREIRKNQAHKAAVIPLPKIEEQNLMAQSMKGLQAIIEEYDGKLITRSKKMSCERHPFADTGQNKEEDIFGVTSERALKINAKWRGSFSDLREAYEDNRSGVPWKDTRAQESIEIIAKPMLNQLAPEHHAGVLQALSAYGKNATQFFVERDIEIYSQRETAYMCEKSIIPSAHVELKKKIAHGVAFAYPHPSLYVSNVLYEKKHEVSFMLNRGSLVNSLLKGNLVSASVSMAQSCVRNTEATALHELGHVIDTTAQLRLQRYRVLPTPYPLALPLIIDYAFRSCFYSEVSACVKFDYNHASLNQCGLSVYAETNCQEFFAEAAKAYVGCDGASHLTNVVTPGASVYSAVNLKMRHPNTFALIDELMRANLDLKKAERSLSTSFSRG